MTTWGERQSNGMMTRGGTDVVLRRTGGMVGLDRPPRRRLGRSLLLLQDSPVFRFLKPQQTVSATSSGNFLLARSTVPELTSAGNYSWTWEGHSSSSPASSFRC